MNSNVVRPETLGAMRAISHLRVSTLSRERATNSVFNRVAPLIGYRVVAAIDIRRPRAFKSLMLIEEAADCPNAPGGREAHLQISVRIFAGFY